MEPLPAVNFSEATPIFVAWLIFYRRKTKTELRQLIDLASQQ
jgi:hypothetical protein